MSVFSVSKFLKTILRPFIKRHFEFFPRALYRLFNEDLRWVKLNGTNDKNTNKKSTNKKNTNKKNTNKKSTNMKNTNKKSTNKKNTNKKSTNFYLIKTSCN